MFTPPTRLPHLRQHPPSWARAIFGYPVPTVSMQCMLYPMRMRSQSGFTRVPVRSILGGSVPLSGFVDLCLYPAALTGSPHSREAVRQPILIHTRTTSEGLIRFFFYSHRFEKHCNSIRSRLTLIISRTYSMAAAFPHRASSAFAGLGGRFCPVASSIGPEFHPAELFRRPPRP